MSLLASQLLSKGRSTVPREVSASGLEWPAPVDWVWDVLLVTSLAATSARLKQDTEPAEC